MEGSHFVLHAALILKPKFYFASGAALTTIIAMGFIVSPFSAQASEETKFSLTEAGRLPEGNDLSSLTPDKSQEISRKITTSTGLAISPLMVAGCLGFYHWWVTSPEKRQKLSVFYQPYVWGTFLTISLLFWLNSCIGTVIPFLKKPMDFIESIENTLSAFLLGLPLIFLTQIPANLEFSAMANPAGHKFAGLMLPFFESGSQAFTAFTWVIWIPVLGMCFFSVWALSQFLNFLIVISPWGGIDLLLRMAKGFVLAAIFGALLISPWLALMLCSLLILSSLLLLRLTVRACCFVLYLSLDLFLGICAPKKEVGHTVRAYALATVGKIKRRSLGKLEISEDGDVYFRAGRKKILPLGEGLEIRHGLLGGVITDASSEKKRDLLRISNRYRLIHMQVAERYGLSFSPMDTATDAESATRGQTGSLQSSLAGPIAWLKQNFAKICSEMKV